MARPKPRHLRRRRGIRLARARGDSSLRGTLSALAAHVRPHRSRTVVATALLLVSGVISLAQPLAAKLVLDGLVHGGAGRALLLLTVLVAIAAAMQAYGNFQLGRVAEAVVLAGRHDLVGHILRLPVARMRRQEPGDLIARVTADTTLLRQIATQSIVQALTGMVLLVGALAMMALVDLLLFATSMAAITMLGAVIALIMPRIRRATGRAQRSVGQMGSAMERVLGAFTTMKAFGAESVEAGRVGAAATAAYDEGVTLARWRSLAGTVAGLAIHATFLVVLGVGGYRVATGAISVSTLVAFLLYVMYLTQPVMQLVTASTLFQAGRAALGRIGEVLRLPTEPLGPRPAAVASSRGPADELAPLRSCMPASLVFEHVSFTYPGRHEPALRDLSLAVPAPGLTALVGPSGAGKSTVLGLIERFYEPDEGRILLDGRELRRWNLAELRASIGYVEQEPTIMAGTLRENLAYAGDASDEELRAALAVTRLEPLLSRLGGDLDADVQHRGLSLSGGERQRIAIARALLRRPRLLLLDEATSQLDAVNEAALRAVVREVSRRTTVVIVAHRLSTALTASPIVVMHDGRLRSLGRHEDLIGADELYAELASHQLLTG